VVNLSKPVEKLLLLGYKWKSFIFIKDWSCGQLNMCGSDYWYMARCKLGGSAHTWLARSNSLMLMVVASCIGLD
jgi:hypothetical protein